MRFPWGVAVQRALKFGNHESPTLILPWQHYWIPLRISLKTYPSFPSGIPRAIPSEIPSGFLHWLLPGFFRDSFHITLTIYPGIVLEILFGIPLLVVPGFPFGFFFLRFFLEFLLDFVKGFSKFFFWNSTGNCCRDYFIDFSRDSFWDIFRHSISGSLIEFSRGFIRGSFTDYSQDCIRDLSRILPGCSPGFD